MNQGLHNLTVLILTYNRPDYVQRTIETLEKYDLKILIMDGSEGGNSFKFDTSKTTYVHSETSYYNRSVMSSKLIKTKYVKMLADDEFLIIKTIDEYINFLENNNNFVSISGKTLGFNFVKDRVRYYTIYENSLKHSLTSEDAFERLEHHFTDYLPTIIYSVLRTSVWQQIFSRNLYLPQNVEAIEEIYVTTLVALLGKCYVNDEIYWLRSGENPPMHRDNNKLRFYSWVLNSKLSKKSYEVFLKNICEVAGLDLTKKKLISQVYYKYALKTNKDVNNNNKFKFVPILLREAIPLNFRLKVGKLERKFENFIENRKFLNKLQVNQLFTDKDKLEEFIKIEGLIINFHLFNRTH